MPSAADTLIARLQADCTAAEAAERSVRAEVEAQLKEAERAQPPPREGADALGLLELGLDLGANGAFGGLGGRAIGLQAGNQGVGRGRHRRPR